MVGAVDSSPQYQASRGAVRTITQLPAPQYAKEGIRVNFFHPAPIVSKARYGQHGSATVGVPLFAEIRDPLGLRCLLGIGLVLRLLEGGWLGAIGNHGNSNPARLAQLQHSCHRAPNSGLASPEWFPKFTQQAP